MELVKLSPKHDALLDQFCQECSEAGYTNNISREAMKFVDGHDLPTNPQYWALLVDGDIASISGCHGYDGSGRILRCLFRSATLPKYQHIIPGTSKTHMNSAPFSLLLPYQIGWGIENGYHEFYITTSHGSHDASGKMNRTHRALQLLAKQGIVDYVGEEEYYWTPQTIWALNLNRYNEALDAFSITRKSLGL
jgi:hypothetical protein